MFAECEHNPYGQTTEIMPILAAWPKTIDYGHR
jgi:hypothetical protein